MLINSKFWMKYKNKLIFVDTSSDIQVGDRVLIFKDNNADTLSNEVLHDEKDALLVFGKIIGDGFVYMPNG